MRTRVADEHEWLVRKLDSIAILTPEDHAALRQLPLSLRTIEAHQPVMNEGDRPSACGVVLEGLLCSTKYTAEGARQIASFYVPGDWPDLQTLHLEVLDHEVVTLTRSRLAFAPHRDIEDIASRYPRIATALWRETLVSGSIYREWVLNLGRREGRQRIAHIFCEMFERLTAVGLSSGDAYRFDVTQSDLADAAGLSPVHINRMLQELRSEGLIEFRGGMVRIPDWGQLKRAGDFDPTYLHQKSRISQ
jgi:CRP-like cAMP-binding protein